MADDLDRRLAELGATDPPPITDARLDAIGERVMAATGTPADGRRRTGALVVAAGLLALLVAGIVLASVRGGDETRLDLADGVTLALPDGDTDTGEAGDDLPDGTVVSIAPGGSAVVDGQRFGPGRYLVVNGEIVPIDAATTSTTSTTTSTTTRPTVGDLPGPSAPGVPPKDGDRPTRTTTTTIDRATPPSGTRPGDRPDEPTDRDRSTTTRPVDRATTTARDRPTTTVRPDSTTSTTTARTTTTTTTTTPPTTTTTTTPPTTTTTITPRVDGGRDRRRP